jgi:hypothetical protein
MRFHCIGHCKIAYCAPSGEYNMKFSESSGQGLIHINDKNDAMNVEKILYF